MYALHTSATGRGAKFLFLLLILMLGCQSPAGEPVQSQAAPTTGAQGAITFYLPYESSVATPDIAGGSATPNVGDPILLGTGLFGQAAKSETTDRVAQGGQHRSRPPRLGGILAQAEPEPMG